MKKLFVTDPDACKGCLICEIACSHSNGEFNPSRAKLYVIKDDWQGVDTPIICTHCNPPPCAAACRVNAIFIDSDTKAVLIDNKKCTGCGDCVLACGRAAITIDLETGLATKCDLCGGDPRCVQYCPTGCLTFAEPETIVRLKRRALADKTSKMVLNLRKEVLDY